MYPRPLPGSRGGQAAFSDLIQQARAAARTSRHQRPRRTAPVHGAVQPAEQARGQLVPAENPPGLVNGKRGQARIRAPGTSAVPGCRNPPNSLIQMNVQITPRLDGNSPAGNRCLQADGAVPASAAARYLDTQIALGDPQTVPGSEQLRQRLPVDDVKAYPVARPHPAAQRVAPLTAQPDRALHPCHPSPQPARRRPYVRRSPGLLSRRPK